MKAHLGAGVHTITFRARSQNGPHINAICRTVITVKTAAPSALTKLYLPEVVYCPQNIEIQFKPNEAQRSVFWKEPVFRSNNHLKQIFKSNLPGVKFGVGNHRVTYIATDQRNQNASCEFYITIHAPGEIESIQ